ncbi:MAG: DUF1638 domain-containing protein [Pseudomonadota bacterium]
MIGAKSKEWPEIVSCGILKREIRYLAYKNEWPVKLRFLDSSLHIDLEKLSKSLKRILSKNINREKIVVYGSCHPQMDDILSSVNAVRTPCQNCVELLLGKREFTEKLSKGAFFLFEDWARRWEEISYGYFKNWDIMREIFQGAHNYILCIETPCSTDFKSYAKEISYKIGLPVVWGRYDLNRLERALKQSVLSSIGRII